MSTKRSSIGLSGSSKARRPLCALRRRVPVSRSVRVSMTDRDVVERVAALFDRAVVGLRARQPHHKRPFASTIKGASAVGLMRAVRPFLGQSRRAQIDRSIATWHGRRPRSHRRSARCSVEGCLRPGSARGLCRRHYNRWRKANRRAGPPTVLPQVSPTAAMGAFVSARCSAECHLAWLAGLLEGEGTFGSYAGYPVLSVQMRDLDVSRAAKILGAASVALSGPITMTGVRSTSPRSAVPVPLIGCNGCGRTWARAGQPPSTSRSVTTTPSV